MISLPTLAEKLTDLGLMQKPFFQCSREEIEALCNAVMNSFDDEIPPDGWQQPVIVEGALVISFRCHPKYHWWKPKSQSIIDTLIELDAPWEVAKHYAKGAITEEKYAAMLVPF